MKQIKTIYKPIEIAHRFDDDVNAAIEEGWVLVKRDVLHPYEGETGKWPRVLYAELEREVVTEAERCCENCAHYTKGSGQEPCRHCGDDADKWEPIT